MKTSRSFLLPLLFVSLSMVQSVVSQPIKEFKGHSGEVTSVAFSLDGRYALSGSLDKTLRLWEVETGKEVRSFKGQSSWVESVAFSPDGRYALSGSLDKTLKLWEVATGIEIRSFKGHIYGVESVTFSPDGHYALSGSDDKTLKLWEVSTGKEVRSFKGHSDEVESVAFSPSGRYALSGSDDKTLKLWEVSTGKEVRSFKGHSDEVESVAFSPSGRYALSGSDDKTLKLWEVSTGNEIRTFKGHSGGVESVAFSPDGRYALSGSNNTLKLWEVATAKEVRSFEGGRNSVRSVTFSPDGRYALSGNDDKTLKLWEKVLPLSEEIANAVAREIKPWYAIEKQKLEDWQQRGEFENTEAYSQRMLDRPNKLSAFKKATENKRKSLTQAVTSEMKQQHDAGIAWAKYRISRYDINNETFQLTVPGISAPFVVKIPLDNAKDFKEQASVGELYFKNKSYVLSDDQWLLVSVAVGNSEVGYYDWEIANRTIYENQSNPIAFEPINLNVSDIEIEQSTIDRPESRYELGENIPSGRYANEHDIAVIIGNRNYASGKNVNFAHNDARMMKKYLIETLGFKSDNIIYKEDADKVFFEQTFGIENNANGQLSKYLRPGYGNVFIFYTGHGAPGLNDSKGYFVPVNVANSNDIELGGYPLSVFYQNISKLKVKDHITIVLDACFSGATFFENISPQRVRVSNTSTGINSNKILVFSSSSDEEVSSWYNAQGHGMFTFFFLKALHNRNADINKDKTITADEMIRYLSDEAFGVPYFANRINSITQTPQLLGEDVERVLVRYK